MSNRVNFLKSIVDGLIKARERSAQVRVRRHLRSYSDRHLQDMGFSRQLLEQGPDAWPWRAPVQPQGAPTLAAMNGRSMGSQAGAADCHRQDADDKLAA